MKLRVLGSVLLCVVGASTFAAADQKAFHGAFCRPFDTDEETSLVYDTFGISAIDDAIDITCPLIRDRVNATNNVSNVAIEAFNATGTMICTLSSQIEDTGGNTLDFHQQTKGTTGDIQFNSFTVDTSNGNEGAYVVECTLNDGDFLYHIHLDEQNGAD